MAKIWVNDASRYANNRQFQRTLYYTPNGSRVVQYGGRWWYIRWGSEGWELSVEAAPDAVSKKKPNPSRAKRMSAALKKYLHSVYPHKTLAGAKVQKNPGGSITIVPIHLRKRSR